MPQITYRVKIIRGTDEFEAEGDKSFVLAMLRRFQDEVTDSSTGAKTLKKVEEKQPPVKKPSSKPVALGEFIRQLGVRRHTEIVLGFGYYLERLAGQKEFTAADINNCYYEAKLESSNTSQMIVQNIKRGTMMTAKGDKGGLKRKYTLTQSGERTIESLIAKAAKAE